MAYSLKRFDFLDGYRGLMAWSVVLEHFVGFNNLVGDYEIVHRFGVFTGVTGFFILSSFLLTYRLLTELQNAKSIKEVFLIIAKYFIRRFFRVYAVFFIFSFANQYILENLKCPNRAKFNSVYDLVTLGNTGSNHLWTIPIEIKYYFLIDIKSVAKIMMMMLNIYFNMSYHI